MIVQSVRAEIGPAGCVAATGAGMRSGRRRRPLPHPRGQNPAFGSFASDLEREELIGESGKCQ